MAIFRGVGGSGSSSDNSFLQEVTAQATTATTKANEASASATSAEASATSAANSLATIQNTEVTSASFNTSDGVLTLTKLGGATVTADLDGRFLTSYTETNDLSSAVTWVNVPNAYITEGSVTQHQAALTITESQISDLQSYLTSYTETNNLTTAVTWANVPDANITESSVTQHLTAANVTSPLTGGTGISVASNGTITNDSPDQTVALTGTGATTVTGTYPNFTIDSTDTTYTIGDGGLTTNDFTDADHTKLNGIEANATADQTGAEIKSAYEAVADTNAFTDAEKSKLLGIEASADVTDTVNVTAAGALMDSEVTNLAQVKAFDSSDYATAAQGSTADSALQNLVEDTTPQLGGDLDLDTNTITGTGRISITQELTSSPALTLSSTDDGAVESPTLRLQRLSSSADDGDQIGQIEFYGRWDIAQPVGREYASIRGVINDATAGSSDGQIDFYLAKAGSQTKLMSLTPTTLELTNGTDLDVAGDITVGGTVDGVDLATTIVDGDFTSNGFMKRTGAGTYTVDTNSYVSTGGGTFYGDVTVTGIPTSGEGTLTANFIKGSTISGGATTPVIDLEKNVTGMNGSGRFIELNTKHHSTSAIVTRGHLGINQSSANGTAYPYFSHNDGNCGFALSYSGSSSYNAIIPASTLGSSTSSNINLGHQYSRWNGIYLKISPNVSSDREYKRDIEELSEAEERVAVACKGLIRKYRMRDAYEEKGENARLHIGIVAQDLQDAFTAEGLDAHRYGMFCSDTWHQATVTTEDEDGNATTSIEDFELVEHAPEGATDITEITRLSVRYEELLAFIISTT